MSDTIRDWELERYLLRELDPQATARIEAALAQDAALRSRLTVLEASSRAILAEHPPVEATRAIADRARVAVAARGASGRRGRWTLAVLGPALASAAVLVTFASHEGHDGGPLVAVDADAGNRVKGSAALVIHRRVGLASEVLRDGDSGRAGDVLQLAYAPAGHAHGVIVSIDGSGGVTLHFPEDARGSTRLERGTTPLPHAYELDPATGFERFFFLTADRPISVSDVLARARTLARDPAQAERAPLAVGDGIDEVSLLVRKQP